MRLAFPITLLAARVALAQFDDAAFVASLSSAEATPPATIYCPTNLPELAGYHVYAWYKADADYYTTASGLATWVNLSSMVTNADALNLTNRVSGTGAQPALQSAALDGHDALYFDGADDYLRSVNYTSPQPHEVWLVLSQTNHAINGYVWDSVSVSDRQYIYMSTSTLWASMGFSTAIVTNQFVSLGVAIKGAGSSIFTNGISANTGNSGTPAMGGLTVGTRYSNQNYNRMVLLEMVTFRTNLTALARWSLNNYFRTNYPSAGIPEQSPP